MPERLDMGGRMATVSYLTRDFKPTTQEKAELIKIVFDDGEVIFAVPS